MAATAPISSSDRRTANWRDARARSSRGSCATRGTNRSRVGYKRRMTRALIDGFGRRISYVRLSVTDRCDFRCRYCMAEDMHFLPKEQLLDFAEIETLVDLLIERGVTRIRLTGGEPLVRRGILDLVATLGEHLGNGLDELTLTTNGSQLAGAADRLFASGVRRVNV